MDLAVSLLTFTMFWKLSYSLQCYTCCPDPERSKSTEPCPCLSSDYSNTRLKLAVCEKSTMCFKRITTLELPDGLTSKSIARGCAPQTRDGEQRKINGKWHPADIEAYAEGCFEEPNSGERSTKTTHCYCKGDQCNGAQKIPRNVLALAVMALSLYLLS